MKPKFRRRLPMPWNSASDPLTLHVCDSVKVMLAGSVRNYDARKRRERDERAVA